MSEKKKAETNVHCPKCGGKIRRTGKTTNIDVDRATGMTMYDAFCDHCGISIVVEDRTSEDRTSFEQEGVIVISFS